MLKKLKIKLKNYLVKKLKIKLKNDLVKKITLYMIYGVVTLFKNLSKLKSVIFLTYSIFNINLHSVSKHLILLLLYIVIIFRRFTV